MPAKTPSPAPALAYSYLRFSSDAQAEGDSVRRQTELRAGWLRRNPHARLDTSLTLEDRGVSGFRGDHRNNKKHALAQFLDLVERGRIPAGSYLIVENLDRLTREDPETSIPLVLSLIKAGVRIVQLVPTEMVYEPGMDFGRLMMMLWELARGHGESKRKSGLLAEAWGEKKRLARDRLPHGESCPAWLELVGKIELGGGRNDYSKSRYVVVPEAAKVVRRIYRWAAEGLGVHAISERLHSEGVKPIGRTATWNRSYVTKLLTSRTVLGEYQPMKGPRKGPRVPDGEPIPGYFPAVVSMELFARVAATRAKRSRPGSRQPRSRHVLAGLVVDATDGSTCYVHSHPKTGPVFVSRDAYEKKPGTAWHPFPVELLTEAVLSRLAELRADELFSDPGAARVAELTTQLGEVERLLSVALAKHEADPESTTWQAQVDKYDLQKRKLVRELADARQEAASPLSASWAEAVGLMARKEPERLRAALHRTVETIRLLVVKQPAGKLAAVQVYFPGGAVRSYLVAWHYRHRSVRPEDHTPWTCHTLPSAAGLDLRDKRQAGRLAELLTLDVQGSIVTALIAGEQAVADWLYQVVEGKPGSMFETLDRGVVEALVEIINKHDKNQTSKLDSKRKR